MRPLLKLMPPKLQQYATNAPIARKDVQDGLIDTFGNYCSYCEMPLGGCEVEHHKALKAWQPTVIASDWNDLLLACKDCREHAAKEVLSLEEKKNMLWPDEDTTFSLAPNSPFIYQQRTVRYLVLDKNETIADEPKTLVFLTPNPLAGEETYNKAKNTIDHFQLNMQKTYFTEGSNVMMVPKHHHQQLLDNRTFHRSKIWEEAEAAIERLKQFDPLPNDAFHQEIKEMLHDQISTTAFFTGNWSIWMTVFNNLIPNNHQLLQRLFIKDQRYFKGIDVQKLGLQL